MSSLLPPDPDRADNSELKTHPVAQKQPSAWGRYDMLGNAREWVEDIWAKDYPGAPADAVRAAALCRPARLWPPPEV